MTFLLTFDSNHGPISYCFRDKRRFASRIANLSHPRVFNAPAEGVTLEFGTGARTEKSRLTGLPDGRKSFKIGLAV